MQTGQHSTTSTPPRSDTPDSWVADHDHDATTGYEGGGQSTARGSTTELDKAPAPTSLWGALMSRRIVGRTQGLFNIVTGLWPMLHMDSFMQGTMPRPEGWVVQAVGGLISTVGIVLFIGSRRTNPPRVLAAVGIALAAAMLAADLALVASGHLGHAYLWDALCEGVFILWWGVALLGRATGRTH